MLSLSRLPAELSDDDLWEIFEAEWHPGRRSGETQVEMAERLGISVATIRRVRRRLEECYGTPEEARKMLKEQG